MFDILLKLIRYTMEILKNKTINIWKYLLTLNHRTYCLTRVVCLCEDSPNIFDMSICNNNISNSTILGGNIIYNP